MGCKSTVVLLAVALALVLTPCQVAAGDVLIMRYGWAPLFCYSGSNSPVPKEYCGLNPPALQRFTSHRALRVVYYGKDGESKTCTDPTSGYSPSAITGALRNALHCTDNSYTIGNDDGWWQFLWNEAGICVAEKTGMTATKYFSVMSDAFKKYNVDSALKKANYDVTKMQQVDAIKILDILQKAFGYRGFYTCDTGTLSKWSTVSICLDPRTYKITQCPAKLLQPNTKCPTSLKIDTQYGGPVSAACLPYYPSFKPTLTG